LGVALDPEDREVEVARAPARRLEQLRREIDAGRVRTGERGAQGQVAGTGRDVEQLVLPLDADAVEQVLWHHHVGDRVAHGGVVPGGPGGAVHALQVGDLDRAHPVLLVADALRDEPTLPESALARLGRTPGPDPYRAWAPSGPSRAACVAASA